jgi:hypothetical protein
MDDAFPTDAREAGALRRTDFLKRAAVAGVGMTAAGALIAAERADAVDIPFPPGETPNPDRGLRAHINRFSHLVINVSDLERAREFYEGDLPGDGGRADQRPAPGVPQPGHQARPVRRLHAPRRERVPQPRHPHRRVEVPEAGGERPTGRPTTTASTARRP